VTLQPVVLRSIEEVDRAAWNDVVRRGGGTAFHTHEWLRVYERTPPAPLYGVHHLLVHRGGELVAVAPVLHSARDPHFASYQQYGYEDPLLEVPMLLCHSFYAYYNRVPSLVPAAEVVPVVVAELERIARACDVGVFGFPGVADDDPLATELEQHGFLSGFSEATSALTLPEAATIEDYWGRLRGSRRRDLRRLARRAAERGVEISWDHSPERVDEFAGLLQAICDHKGSPTSYPPEHLHALFAELGPSLRLLSLRLDDRMLGAFVLLQFEDALNAWIAGLDYERSRDFGTYYLLFQEVVTHAIEQGISRVEAGRGGYPNKISLGYEPTLMRCWFRATSPAAEARLRASLDRLDRALDMPGRLAAAYETAGVTPKVAQPA
jgi:predicted N-acyltransferase